MTPTPSWADYLSALPNLHESPDTVIFAWGATAFEYEALKRTASTIAEMPSRLRAQLADVERVYRALFNRVFLVVNESDEQTTDPLDTDELHRFSHFCFDLRFELATTIEGHTR